MSSDADDYTVIAHIIEARSIKNLDTKSTSSISPVCQVELFDETDPQYRLEKTEMIMQKADALWDKMFVWRGIKMDSNKLSTASITFRVFDGGGFFRNVELGRFSVDLKRVYDNTNHELYKQWGALLLPERYNIDFRGFIKVSIIVLRGNETPYPHTEEEDEDEGEDDNLTSMLLDVPKISAQFTTLRVSIFKLEHVNIETSICTTLVRFGNNPPVKTKEAVVQRTSGLIPSVDIWEELQVPVQIPTLANMAHLELMDAVFLGRDTTIGKLSVPFEQIQFAHQEDSGSAGVGPLWLPLYRTPQHEFDEPKDYLGRMLVHLEANFSEKTENARINHVALKHDLPSIPEEVFVLRFDLLSGSEFNHIDLGKSVEIWVEFGPTRWRSKRMRPVNGEIRWYERMKNVQIKVQTDYPDSMYRVVIKAMEVGPLSADKCIGYIVYKYDAERKALVTAGGEEEPLGFSHIAKWRALTPDRGAHNLDEDIVPGFLMFKLDLGRARDMPTLPQPALEPPPLRKYQLRAHVYQACDLPAAEPNGSSNPLVIIRCSSRVAKTEARYMTLNAMWYQTLRLDNVELPTVLAQAPDISLIVAHQVPGRTYREVLLGRAYYPVHRIGKTQSDPTWIPLRYPQDDRGRLLISMQLIPMEEASQVRFVSIWPQFRDCLVEMDAVGVRGLKPFGLSNLAGQKVYLEVDCGAGTVHHELDPIHARTADATVDDQLGVNFFERIRVPVKIPLRDLRTFTPYMTVRVFVAQDKRHEIRRDTLIGFTSVSLIYDIPWAKAGARPRLTQAEMEAYELERSREAEAAKAAEAKAASAAAATAETAGSATPPAGAGVRGGTPVAEGGAPGSSSSSSSGGGGGGGGGGVSSGGSAPPVRPLCLPWRWARERRCRAHGPRGQGAGGEAAPPGGGDASAAAVGPGGGQPLSPPPPGGDIVVDMRVLNEKLEREYGSMQFRKEKAGDPSGDQPLIAGERTLGEAPASALEGAEDDEARDDKTETEEKPIEHPIEPEPIERRKDFTSLFFDFPLQRGKHRNFSLWERLLRRNYIVECGSLRAAFRVLTEDDIEDEVPRERLADVCRPRPMVVRVYVEKAEFLSVAGSGRAPRPYLRIEAGNKTLYSEKGKVRKFTNPISPEFYIPAQGQMTLPGTSQLTVSVWDDPGALSRDELIGSAVIDLETRMFSDYWRNLSIKPKERFPLRSPSCQRAQGYLWMWIELLTPEQAAQTPMEKFVRMDPMPFELRAVVWNTKDVIPLDYSVFTSEPPTSDIMVGGEYNDRRRQYTDVHYNSSSGEGWFNWRMKWEVTVPVPEGEKKQYRLYFGVWNHNYLSPNDVICEGTLNLQKWLMKARRQQRSLTLPRQWITLLHPNFGTEPRGKLELSLEVLTAEDAARRPAGFARDAPNENPFLETPQRPNQGIFDRAPFRGMRNYVAARKGRICGCCCCCVIVVLLVLLIPLLIKLR